MKRSRVSVIVAVYNAEKTLRQCLDSLVGQTLSDIDIVCIDDCSSDASADILSSYAGRDGRVKLIRQKENSGQAKARNAGLRIASGEYIAFCDSDDFLSPTCLELAARTLDEHPRTGCALLDVENYDESTGLSTPYPMPVFDVMEGREAFLASLFWKVHGVYVARRELYERFPWDDTCPSYSDDNTTRLHYFHSEEVRTCAGTYFYRMNPLSVTRRPSIRRFYHLRANEHMRELLLQLHVEDSVLKRYEAERQLVLVDCYMVYHFHARDFSREHRQQALAMLRRAWQSISLTGVDDRRLRKFGYRHLCSWPLFRLQEYLYFSIRNIIHG